MRFGSAASGIEAASVAWKPLGFEPAWYSEIDPFCCSLLTERHGDTPNLGNMNDITTHALRKRGRIDCLIAGTPCQSYSVAGKREGLKDPRGQLALRLLDILEWTRPRWLVWENVAGVLSSNNGRDFGTFLRSLAERGYGWAYRVLDAQFFGVPQRRRRVFVVGHLGDWTRAAAVLFEPASVSGDSPKGGKTGTEVTGCLAARTRGGGGLGTDFECDGGLQPIAYQCQGSNVGPMGTLRAGNGHETGGVPFISGTLCSNKKAAGSATSQDAENDLLIPVAFGGNDTRGPISVATARNAKAGSRLDFESETFLVVKRAVRRLTPRECERLMGLPDDYTLITYRGKPAADGPRYKAIGNSIAIPVLRWIGIGLLEQQ